MSLLASKSCNMFTAVLKYCSKVHSKLMRLFWQVFLYLHWAIPEKIQTGDGVEDIIFGKAPLEILDLSQYPKKFRRKKAFNPGNSANLCDTLWKFQSQNQDPWKFRISFSWTPPEFALFLKLTPGISLCFIFKTSGNSMCSTAPVWIFSGTAYCYNHEACLQRLKILLVCLLST